MYLIYLIEETILTLLGILGPLSNISYLYMSSQPLLRI